MIRKLLATTAMAGLFATGALAQETVQPTPPATEPAAESGMPATDDAAATDAAAEDPSSATADAGASGGYLQSLSTDQYLASELDGQSIYGSDAADAETVGDIQNHLVDSNGQITHAIVNATVNDESRTVALPFDQIAWSTDENNEPRAVLTGGAEALAQAQVFTERMAAADPATAPAAGTSAATDPAMAPADPAMAPADPAAAPADDTAAATDPAMAPATGAVASAETLIQGDDQYLSTDLLGQAIRSTPGDDAEDIGEVNDLVISSAGQVEAAVVGVGGFLGIGEKNVAVPFDQFQVTREDGDEPLFVLAATQEQLEQAPAFEGDRDAVAAADGTAASDDLSQQAAATGAATGAAVGAAAGSAVDTTEEVADNAGQSIENAADAAGQSVENAATATGNAAAGVGAEIEQETAEAGAEIEQETAQAGAEIEQETAEAGAEIEQEAAEAGAEVDQATDGATDLAQNESGMATTGADVTDPAAGGAMTGETAAAGAAAGGAAGGMAAGTDTSTTASTGGSMQEGMTPVESSAPLTADELMGTTVYGPNDENIGSVGDIAMNAEGQVDAVIVDVGGFLGIGAKPVAVGLDNLQLMRDGSDALYLYTQFTQDQLENAPAYDEGTYADNRDTMRLQNTAPAETTTTTTN